MSGIFLAVVGASYGAAPVNTVAPAVTGTATVGQTLSTTNGTWTGAPAPTFTYQWQRTGVDISAATSSTYVLVAADYANTIRCVVKATNTIAPSGVTANSNSTASVAGNAPVNTVAPAVTGTATFGSTLTSTTGTWTGTPTPSFTYQWQRVTTNIASATSSTYVLVAADVGNTIRCVVTATNAVSAVSANSNSTASVAAVVPGAPTIGTATQTGATSATVAYTAPASNGGATITLYTATSSPSSITGTLATAGSGTITVSGLATGTAYTFTVKATNSIGQSAASGSSNSVTPVAPTGQQAYTTAGAYTWVAPADVTKVSILAVAAGGQGNAGACCCGPTYAGAQGYGAGVSYGNNITVVPGNSYPLRVGASAACATLATAQSWFNGCNSSAWVYARAGGNRAGGLAVACCGRASQNTASFGSSRCTAYGRGNTASSAGGGGSGAAGYLGSAGNCKSAPNTWAINPALGMMPYYLRSQGQAASGTGGGGAGSAGYIFTNAGGTVLAGSSSTRAGGGGGGVGLLGAAGDGSGGGATLSAGGGGGAGGSAGTTAPYCAGQARSTIAGAGGAYGGGGGAGNNNSSSYAQQPGQGGVGAIRIIWPGNTRSYPNTNTGDL